MARPSRSDPFEARLRAIYAEADALFAGWTCPGLARCCQFGVTGRQPELWPVEWRVLERALRARPAAKAGRIAGDCPAFDPATRRCRAYDDRPFGCRTHFCDEAVPDGKNPRAAIRALARDLAALAEEADVGAKLLPMLSHQQFRTP